MDILTHIALGAAVGELTLGPKIGNRAMLWGAIGCVIPDLDVLGNFSTDQLGALASHRAMSHSLMFAVMAPVGLGWMVYRIYALKGSWNWWRDFMIGWVTVLLLMIAGNFQLPLSSGEAMITALAVSLGMVMPAWLVVLRERRIKRPETGHLPSWLQWTGLIFASIIVHPLLDCCTTFGTQIYQPFSDFRAAIDNISVVDPLYTLPFVICVLMAARLTRGSSRRRLVNYLGIGLSSAYMLFSFYNKARINRVFETSLQKQEISYRRMMTTPTIFNNMLWQGIAEADTAFYIGEYSLFDDDKDIRFYAVAKNHHLLEPYQNDRAVHILDWFSNGYYSVDALPGGRLQFNDLRFGFILRSATFSENFVFKYILEPGANELQAFQNEASRRDMDGAFEFLWERIKGDQMEEGGE